MPTRHSIEAHTPDEAFFESWDVVRGRGFWRFVLVEGTTGGAISAAVFSFLEWLLDHVFDLTRLTITFLIFIVVGCTIAPLVWWRREARYKRLAAARAAKG